MRYAHATRTAYALRARYANSYWLSAIGFSPDFQFYFKLREREWLTADS
ncbi:MULTISPECIES: hypothetical protein [unclassified Moorena]|nr:MULTISPECIES: hypothetical protein [unclassified Moorena]NER85517.1 hypothetical protein [Moorena sp. SIO3A2]NES46470.1 hypothetical protein [Moorena sp. SIO2C4]